jgi:DNA polymerase I
VPGTLLLLDGHSLAYRAFYALPVENFSTTTGQPTNAVYGFTSMLINVLRDEAPTHVAVAFDVSRKTFRTEAFPEYKATRTASPEGFSGQVGLIRQVLDALSIPSFAVEGYEADDVIATLTTQARSEGFDVLIVTGDRDAFQLVDDHVTVLYPRKGVSDLARMTPAAVIERYGLDPQQYPDFAALRGDPSDNLPSVPGVGEKTAAKWVREFGSLAQLVARADEVPGKAGAALREHLAQVTRNRELTELVRDMSLDCVPDDLMRREFQRDDVHALFDALQFRVLRDRLFQTMGEEVSAAAGDGLEVEIAQVPDGALGAWLADQARGHTAGVAVLGTWGRGTGVIDALAIATLDGPVAVVVPADISATDRASLAAYLDDPQSPKVMHDAKGALLALRAMAMPMRGLAGDTALSAYLVVPGQRSFDLADLAARFLGRELASDGRGDSDGQLALGGTGMDTAAVAVRARAIVALAAELDAEVTRRGGSQLLATVELPLVSLLADMEATGIAVDHAQLVALEAEFASAVAEVEQQAHDLVGRPFNLGSPKQLQEILFGERGLPKTKRIKTGFTTDADALAWLAQQSDDPLPPVLLRWRDVSRLRQTVEGLIKSTDADHRIRTTFNQMIAATGRLSSTEPNLQNIPVRTQEGRRIREAFVVGPGFEGLLTADYSQIEMRIMAHLSQDPGLIAAFRDGEDLHTTVASRVFDVPAADVDPEMRRRIKAMSYGLAYGLSPFGLAQQLDIGTDEARALMDEYFLRFGGIRDYLRDVVERARATGYTETLLGRRRYLPDLTSDNRQRREMAERMALNAPIQGSAADVIKVAMLNVARALTAEGLTSRLLLQVHDELVLEVAPGERDLVEAIVRREMGSAVELDVALDVSVGVGHSWHEAAH